MKKIKMLTRSAGPEGVFAPGAVRVVSDEVAKELIKGKFAQLLEEIKEKKVEKKEKEIAEETATAEPPENAMQEYPKRRRKKSEAVQELPEDIQE